MASEENTRGAVLAPHGIRGTHQAREEISRCVWAWYVERDSGARMAECIAHAETFPDPERQLLIALAALRNGGPLLPDAIEVIERLPEAEAALLGDLMEHCQMEGKPPPPDEEPLADAPARVQVAASNGAVAKVGDSVRLKDWGNWGKVEEIRDGRYLVRTTNPETGQSREHLLTPEEFDHGLPAGSLQVLDRGEVLQMPPPKWIVEGLIPAGDLCFLYGPSEAGKSFVALDIAQHVAAGIPWFGAAVQAGAVLYCLGEGVGHLAPRLAAWDAAHPQHPIAPGRFRVATRTPRLLDQPDVEQAITLLAGMDPRPVLLVIDTLARALLGGEENSARDVGLAIEALDRVRREAAIGILVLHHTGKDRAAGERGSSAIRAAADVMLRLDPHGEGKITLACDKARDSARARSVDLQLQGVAVTVQGQPARSCVVAQGLPPNLEAQPGAVDAALRALSENEEPGEGLTWGQWLAASGLSKGTFVRAVRTLLAQCIVTADGPSRRKRYVERKQTT